MNPTPETHIISAYYTLNESLKRYPMEAPGKFFLEVILNMHRMANNMESRASEFSLIESFCTVDYSRSVMRGEVYRTSEDGETDTMTMTITIKALKK